MSAGSHPSTACLRRIRSLSRFKDEQLEQLSASLPLDSAASGDCLIELGEVGKWSLYLVEGAVRAIAHDGTESRITAAIGGELSPIGQVRPSEYRILADEPTRYFKLYSEQLADFARQEIEPGADSETGEIELDPSSEQSLFQIQLFKDLIEGELQLPSLPNVARRIEQAFADNLVTAETVSVIIQSDPVITAKIIMISNSALYGGLVQIESLKQAVARLGLENTRKLVMSCAIKELFDSKTAEMKSYMHAVWKHSQHVASLCRLLAERLDGFDSEQAQLAGLVHDIGEVAILQYAQQHEELRSNPAKLFAAVKSMRPQITGMLLEQWNFGSEFVTVGQECEEWFRNPADQPDLCDLVVIAQYHAMIGTPMQRSLPPIAALPAFDKLGMGNLAIEQIIEFMQKSRDKLKSIESHLDAI